MLETLTPIIIASVIIVLIRWAINLPVSPDPWDDEINKQDFEDNAKPICLKCTKLVKNPNQHYCPHCGNITGKYTRYLPFINIRFNYSIFESLWKKAKNNKTIFPAPVLYLFWIIIFVPSMIIIGILILLYFFMKKIKIVKSNYYE